MSHSVTQAKNNLPELIKLAENGKPQIIRRHEREVAVLISVNEWKRLKGKQKSIVQVFREGPMVGLDLDFSRQKEYPREVVFER